MTFRPFSGRVAPGFLAILLIGLNSLASHAGQLSPALSNSVALAAPDDRLSVIFSLREQVDTQRLTSALQSQVASRATTHQIVVSELQITSRRTQRGFLEELERLRTAGDVDGFTSYWIANLVVVSGSRDAILALADHPSINQVELNMAPRLIEPIDVYDPGTPSPATRGRSGVPIGVRAIRADKVWKDLGVTGAGTIVACLDTGVDFTHAALRSSWRGMTADAAASWFNVVDHSSRTPFDGNGHGTHVTGTMCGLSEYGDSIGVAFGAQWIAANGLSLRAQQGNFNNFIIDSFQWFADPDGDPATADDVPDVVQNSWGVTLEDDGYSVCEQMWWDAIDNCEAAGVVVTFSAGNSGSGERTMASPADRATTPLTNFSVGAVDVFHSGELFPFSIAGFSSRGPSNCAPRTAIKPELVAPGVDVYSAWAGQDQYRIASGTSMAGPHVAGVVALMREVNPDLTVDEVKQILIDTAHPYDGVEDNTYGHGMLDAFDAVLAAAAANGSGRLTGNVRHGEDPVAGASVRLLGTNQSWITAGDGRFGGFVSLGEYSIRVGHPLFETRDFSSFEVDPATPLELNFDLTDKVGPWIQWFDVTDAVSSIEDSVDVVAQLEDFSGVATVELFSRRDPATWEAIPMHSQLPNHWKTRLPGKQFGATYELYLRAVDQLGQVSQDPIDGEAEPLRVTLRKSVLRSDGEIEQDWLLAADGDTPSGKWIRIDPFATEYLGQAVAPEDDHSRDGARCFVTGKGKRDVEVDRADVDDGCVTLRSPLLDLRGLESATLEYWRWFANEGSVRAGSFEASITSDGGFTWVVLETIFASQAEWTLFEAELAGLVEFTDQVQVRFVACDFADDSLIEAAVDDFWIRGMPPKVIGEQPDPPEQSRIVSASPNPFSERTRLAFTLAEEVHTEVILFDPSGRRIRELLSEVTTAGDVVLPWDGRNDAGQIVPSGIYFYRLRAGLMEEVGRVLRIQ